MVVLSKLIQILKKEGRGSVPWSPFQCLLVKPDILLRQAKDLSLVADTTSPAHGLKIRKTIVTSFSVLKLYIGRKGALCYYSHCSHLFILLLAFFFN